MLYETYVAIYNGAKLDLNSGTIDASEANEKFVKSLGPLEECLEHLKFEMEGTQEKQLYDEAAESFEALKSLHNVA